MRVLLAMLLILSATAVHADQTITFVSWGGSTQAAQSKAWAEPFSAETGIRVEQAGPTDYAAFKAMVENGKVTWDVVDVEADFALRAGREGLLEPLDFKQIAKRTIDPRFVTIYGVGSFYFSFILGYNTQVLSSAPQGWAALFDTQAYPGKRALYKWPSPGVLEIALLADGVAADALYPLDLDRAFRKLDSIRNDIAWWGSGDESQQLLASGDASLGMFWNGRVNALQGQGAPVAINWQQNLVTGDFLVIPRGTPNLEAARQFMAYATSPEPQAAFAELTGYAPVNLSASELVPVAAAQDQPGAHKDSQITLDFKYWSLNGERIAERWNAWQASN
ncbi:ABC transporter substrate-binding protein [Phytopseudomonas dryadis]|uniref:ABC transporter substrate-binding protein n=1 Tax=Phytopseudomonas dryadis TaxID=2487520 RepID=A0ABY1Z6Z4_9GAMM|nr:MULTISPECIES: ABC transporter substrate-binding protein [Pseudomonas]TBV04367.1 ABC transporter substrate-binding protein [Pseudomonas dryadis]TBV17093.1 ABC transporter substrate-binding protein [Pseudomonas sp. FRB 230]